MDIKSLILNTLSKKEWVRAQDIVRVTGLSRAYVNRFFQELRREGKILLLGKANKARYASATSVNFKKAKSELTHFKRVFKNSNLFEDRVLGEIKAESGIFFGLSENVSKILDYAFTEMMNNAIEHSMSKTVAVDMSKNKGDVGFAVSDGGIGIFKNIMGKYRLENELEAIRELLKGKRTTSPEAHTGEGIFFTSKIADALVIKSSNKKLLFNNLINDIFIRDLKPIRGTKVEFQISLKSKRDLNSVFREYGGEAFEFAKTKVVVDLYKLDKDFISRSQARRIVSGLDQFKSVMLDFKDVSTVGQAFADEVFRVWQARNPIIEIRHQNANDNIKFMINRAKTR